MKEYTVSNFLRITTAGDNADIGGGDCILDGIVLPASPAGTITVYNNTAASGTAAFVIPAGAPAGPWSFGIYLGTGLSVTTSQNDEVIVTYRSM